MTHDDQLERNWRPLRTPTGDREKEPADRTLRQPLRLVERLGLTTNVTIAKAGRVTVGLIMH